VGVGTLTQLSRGQHCLCWRAIIVRNRALLCQNICLSAYAADHNNYAPATDLGYLLHMVTSGWNLGGQFGGCRVLNALMSFVIHKSKRLS